MVDKSINKWLQEVCVRCRGPQLRQKRPQPGQQAPPVLLPTNLGVFLQVLLDELLFICIGGFDFRLLLWSCGPWLWHHKEDNGTNGTQCKLVWRNGSSENLICCTHRCIIWLVISYWSATFRILYSPEGTPFSSSAHSLSSSC